MLEGYKLFGIPWKKKLRAQFLGRKQIKRKPLKCNGNFFLKIDAHIRCGISRNIFPQYYVMMVSYYSMDFIFSIRFCLLGIFFLYNIMKNIMFYRRVWVMSCTRWLHSTHSALLLRIWILYTESRLWNLRLPGKLSQTAIREILNPNGDEKFK